GFHSFCGFHASYPALQSDSCQFKTLEKFSIRFIPKRRRLTMRFIVAAMLVLVGGCSGSPASSWGTLDWQWSTFDGFQLERQPRSFDAEGGDAVHGCATIGAALPTEWEYTVVHDVAFDGITAPVAEWYAGDSPRWYYAPNNTYYLDPPFSGLAVGYRCAR